MAPHRLDTSTGFEDEGGRRGCQDFASRTISAESPPCQVAETLRLLGCETCGSVDMLVHILRFYGYNDIGELDVAHILGMMAKPASSRSEMTCHSVEGEDDAWNIDALVDALQIVAPGLSWCAVVQHFDHDGFYVNDEQGLVRILKAFRLGCSDAFPVGAILKEWRNSRGQLAFIRACLLCPYDIQETCLLGAGRSTFAMTQGMTCPEGAVWSSAEVVACIMMLADKEGFAAVDPLFEIGLARNPCAFLLGLAQCWPSASPLYIDVLQRCFSCVSKEQPSCNAHVIMQEMWGISKECFEYCLRADYLAHRSLEAICRTQKLATAVCGLEDILSMQGDWGFVMDLAIYSDLQGELRFSVWLPSIFEKHGNWAAVACVHFLRDRVYNKSGKCGTRNGWLSVAQKHVDEMMQCLRLGSFTGEALHAVNLLNEGPARCRLLGGMPPTVGSNPLGPGAGAGTVSPGANAGVAPGDAAVRGPGGMPAPGVAAVGVPAGDGAAAPAQPGQPQQPAALFAADIEEEANSHFQRIYTSEIEIERVIQMLKGFKASTNQREQEVFACMIHNLFDEYRFFPRYPERELLITGKLFGSLIQHQLVSSITLGIALRYVLEALRKPFRTNMFKFGMCALEQFKPRLVEWPQYCHHINQIAHIRESHKDIIEYIQRALANGRPAGTEGSAQAQVPAPMQQQQQQQQQQQPMDASTPNSGSPPQLSSAVPAVQAAPPMPGMQAGVQPQALQLQQQLLLQSLMKPQAESGALAHTSSASAQAYGAFGGPPGAHASQSASGAYGGFSSGFGQEPGHQLPNALQNLAPADVSGQGGGSSNAAESIDMRNSNVQQTLSVVSGASAFGAPTNVDMLLQRAKQVQAPDVSVQDKVHFVFNNLSNTNLEQKEKDLLSAVTETYMPWMCQYIVIKRAAQEANYHSLYIQFVDRLDKKFSQLLKGVIACTIDNIKILLADDQITSSSSLRSLLKNLGSWLGGLTLQKNKPILQKDIDFKQLMVDAFDKGRLIAVIPFIAKVMESCSNSRIFRPPNPWTMLVLSLMAELHPLNDLKLNIKFEIEVLCKNLNRELKDIKPTSVLKNRSIVKEGNPDWTSRDTSGALGALKSLPTVPDARLLAAAAGLSGLGAFGTPLVPDEQQGGAAAGASLQMLLQSQQQQQKPQQQPPLQQQPQQQQQQPQQAQQQQSQLQQVPQASQAQLDSMQKINIGGYVIINPNIMGIFQQFPQLRNLVIAAINQAITEIILPVVERSVTIACITTRELILKDLAFESDETQVKVASHVMVQNLAGSLALVTCKEPLRHSMCSQVRNALLKAQVVDAQWVEQAAQVIAQENLDLGCNLIEKAATEKALRDVDFQIAQAIEMRRTPKTPMNDQFVQMQTWLRYLPEALRPKTGTLLPHQKRVYDDFAKLPRDRLALSADPAVRAFEGQQSPPAQAPAVPPQPSPGPLAAQGVAEHARLVVEKCTACMNKAEELILRSPPLAAATLASLPQGHELTQLILQARSLVLQSSAREDAAVGYAQKLFRRLYDSGKFGRCTLGIEWITASLASLNDLTKRISKEVTTWLAFADNERRLNRELAVAMVMSRLLILSAPNYVKEIIKVVDMGRNQAAVDFVVSVLQQCVIDKRVVPPTECVALLEALAKVAQVSRAKPHDPLVRLLEESRALARTTAAQQQLLPQQQLGSGTGVLISSKMRETPDPPGLRDQVQFMLDKWVVQVQTNDERGVVQFMDNLLEQGWLKGDDMTDRFFRICVELSIDRCYAALADASLQNVSYMQVDALSKLVLVLVRCFDEWNRSTTLTKTSLVNKALATIVKVMHQHHTERKTAFNQKPFHRLMTRLLLDLTDAMPDAIIFSFAEALQACQPRLLSGFSFAWLELASHKSLMPRLLQAKANKGWTAFQRLMMGLFKYMEPYLRNAELLEPIKLLYKGTLRVLLVLLHDFPEFLCEYHLSFCDAIPPSCIQLRNLILSAFPRHMVLPDPFTPQLKVDLLPEINKPPAILSPFSQVLASSPLRVELDKYLKGRGSPVFLNSLASGLLLTNPAEIAAVGTRYNTPLMNSLVLYTAAHAISQNGGQGKNPLNNGPSMEILRKLCRDLDTEGRYLFLNAIANQLRYPNSHTHYFSCVLLSLFQQTPDLIMVREQITRVLIERLIVNKPHPWGLLITFIELIKNPIYDFWHHEFVRSSKEIEQLFQSVARFCLPQQQLSGLGNGAGGGVGGAGTTVGAIGGVGEEGIPAAKA